MKLATKYPAYSDAKAFEPPSGVVAVPVQITSTLPSGNEAVTVRTDYFVEGTEPQAQTPQQAGGGGILSRLFHTGNSNTAQPGPTPLPLGDNPAASPDASKQPEEKKGGVLKQFFSIFKGKSSQPENPPDSTKKPPAQ
jgi:hypothetical protein